MPGRARHERGQITHVEWLVDDGEGAQRICVVDQIWCPVRGHQDDGRVWRQMKHGGQDVKIVRVGQP